MKEIPSFIDGEERFTEIKRDLLDFNGKKLFKVNYVDEWGLNAAIKSAMKAQDELVSLSDDEVIELLSKTAKHFFTSDAKYKKIVKITGSPFEFVKWGIEFVKDWCRTGLDKYMDSAGLRSDGIIVKNSSPLFAILPSSSEHELLWVIAMTLLSKNSIVIRPSTKGAGAYVALELMQAYDKAIEETGLESIRGAVSIVNTTYEIDFLSVMSIDGWNYLSFGSCDSLDEIEKKIRENCTPRTFTGYGTGLSMSVVFDDSDDVIKKIMESVTINKGNECDATDIIYIYEDVYDEVFEKLLKEASKYKSGDPFDKKTIGLVEKGNVDYIVGELIKWNNIRFIKTTEKDGNIFLHATVIPLSDNESAIEYPGPVVSVRRFDSVEKLGKLIKKDVVFNGMEKNLVTSVFGNSGEFEETLPFLKSYTVKYNKGTHEFNINLPHQGKYLTRELVEVTYLD